MIQFDELLAIPAFAGALGFVLLVALAYAQTALPTKGKVVATSSTVTTRHATTEDAGFASLR